MAIKAEIWEPQVSIIIPTFNSEKTIGKCLDSISRLDYPSDDCEVIVIDNGSGDRTTEIIDSYNTKLYVKQEISIAEMRNHGVGQSDGKVIAFVDSDCILSAQWLSVAIEHLRDPKVGIVGCGYDFFGTPSWIERHWYYLRSAPVGEVTFVPAGNMAIRKATFLKVNGFNPELETGEDSDLCLRLRRSGFKIISDPRMRNVHLGNPKSLRQFFLKEVWYGRGFKACINSNNWGDRTFLMSNLFLLGLIILAPGISILLLNKNAWLLSVSLSICALVVLISTAYRSFKDKKYASVLHLALLYLAYYLARSIAVFTLYVELVRNFGWKRKE